MSIAAAAAVCAPSRWGNRPRRQKETVVTEPWRAPDLQPIGIKAASSVARSPSTRTWSGRTRP